ncbi:MAG TPA: hypothetical protein VIN75_17995, partial [Burkholderiaceae bacterium]
LHDAASWTGRHGRPFGSMVDDRWHRRLRGRNRWLRRRSTCRRTALPQSVPRAGALTCDGGSLPIPRSSHTGVPMVATSSSVRSKKPPERASAVRHERTAAPRGRHPSASIDRAASTIRERIVGALDKFDAIEGEVAGLVRASVSESLAAARGAVVDVAAVIREVFAGTVDAAGQSAGALRLGIQGAARGTVAGVHDAGGDLGSAVTEIVKAAIAEGHRVGAEIGSVVRYALDGVSQGLAEVGKSTAHIATRAAQDALATAVGISALAAEAVRQVILGTAEGMEEVARRHRAERASDRR